MAEFGYNQLDSGENKSNNKSKFAKVAYFKLANDGDVALVRFNIKSVDDLKFATVHSVAAGNKFRKVSCLNEVGQTANVCPFCAAAANGNKNVSKVKKVVYLPLLVSYLDKNTGVYSEPVAAIWEKNAFYGSKEIATKISSYGDLTEVLFTVTRCGMAKDTQTTYSIDYATEKMFPQSRIPKDFSEFENYTPAKNSYWSMTADEMNEFLKTGTFPEPQKKAQTATATAEPTQQPPFMAPQYANTGTVSSVLDAKVELTNETPAEPVGNVIAEAEALLNRQAQAAPAAQPAQPAQAIPSTGRTVRSFGTGFGGF